MTGFFNEAYRGTPPWDIGRPQDEFVRLGRSGEIRGRVLDVGCGTGENAIFFAELGLDVWGVDAAPLAIERAQRKASQRRANVNFTVADALHLDKLKRKFDTVTDCGLFHTFSDDEREKFPVSLASVLAAGGIYFMLCFSDKEPTFWGGPRRVSKEEITHTFRSGWRINYIKEARFGSRAHDEGGRAWLSSIGRI